MPTPTLHRTIFLSDNSYNIQKVGASSATKNSTDSYEATVGYIAASTTIDYAVIKFDLPTTSSGRQVFMSGHTIDLATFYFYVYSGDNTDPIQEIEIVYITEDPATASADDLYTAISSADALTSKIINTNNKELISINISNLSILQTKIQTNSSHYTLAIRRKDTLTSSDGEVKVGGLTQSKGNETSWAAATNPFIAEPSYLLMNSNQTTTSNQRFYMRYTTLDPTTEQSTPSNSIGGYIAPSPASVYDQFQLLDDINSIQTTFEVSDLPDSSSGLLQAGIEIIKYEGINSSNDQITNITRGVSGSSFSYDPFSEYAHYLDIDKLFDKNPTDALVQYRCVAIYLSASTTVTVSDINVFLIKPSDSHTTIDIGIEVPEIDVHEGTLSANVSSGDTTFSSATGGSYGLYGFSANYFEGAYIVIDPDGTAFETFISSHSDGGSEEDFVVTDTMPAFSSGTTVRIWPSQSQRISSEDTRPVENSDRFLGFFSEGGTKTISLNEKGNSMTDGDIFYIWIKRELNENVSGKADTGASILVNYSFEDLS